MSKPQAWTLPSGDAHTLFLQSTGQTPDCLIWVQLAPIPTPKQRWAAFAEKHLKTPKVVLRAIAEKVEEMVIALSPDAVDTDRWLDKVLEKGQQLQATLYRMQHPGVADSSSGNNALHHLKECQEIERRCCSYLRTGALGSSVSFGSSHCSQ